MRWLRAYLGYSRHEALGMLLLLALILGALFVPMLLRPELPEYLAAQDAQELDRLVASLREHRLAEGSGYASRYPKKAFGDRGSKYPPVAQVALASFDPNTLDATAWEARGVPHFVAVRLVKYRDAAGGFKSKAQIKKMYGLEPPVYERLAPFMQLPDDAPRRERADYAAGTAGETAGRFPRKPRHLQPFDLNLADTTQLMQIRGIGAGRAKWVVRYGNTLGGYLNEAQLDEVFVLRDAPDLRDSLRKYTFVAAGFVPQPVRVNSAPFEELYLHPYVRKGLARAIVTYRGQHGGFKTVEELKSLPRLKAEDWEKLRPYVRCE